MKLGNPNGTAALRRAVTGGALLRAAVTADAFACGLAPTVRALQDAGHRTLRALAAELNARGIRTRRGGRWQVSNVRNLLQWLAD
ncbi:recombinase family protein [Jannaschia formosa]|uniref:recombinase family protein n=1 Tax=Jannaschia formosa TaxID=2259592 RepID=UPI001FD7A66A|nr:recombinase family protein [Jannaschia formosa]